MDDQRSDIQYLSPTIQIFYQESPQSDDNEKIMLRLREELARLLKERGMTAAELARRAGVPKQSLSDWMSGSRPRNLDHVKKTAVALGVSLDQLCYADPTAKEAPPRELEDLVGDGWLSGVFEVRLRRLKRATGGPR